MLAEVSLENIEFYAYHGFYEQEQKIGNKFSVDVVVQFDYEEYADSENLENTINYEKIYQSVKLEMHHKQKLLETIAKNIITHIHTQYPFIINCKVSISKFGPPIGGRCQKAKVTLEKKFITD